MIAGPRYGALIIVFTARRRVPGMPLRRMEERDGIENGARDDGSIRQPRRAGDAWRASRVTRRARIAGPIEIFLQAIDRLRNHFVPRTMLLAIR